MNHPPFQLRDGWYCVVNDVRQGPWPDQGSCSAGYDVERRRAAEKLPKFYECGICQHLHPAEWNGDCRDDKNRFTTSFIEDKYGEQDEGWLLVPMP